MPKSSPRGPHNLTFAFAHVVVAVTIAVSSFGCARPRVSPVPGRTVVNIWSGWIGHEQKYFEEALQLFNRSQDTYYAFNTSTLEKAEKLVRAITAGTPPDVCVLSYEGETLGPLAANDAIMPLDLLLEQSEVIDKSAVIPATYDQCRYRGRLFAIPFLIDVHALQWNHAVYEKFDIPVDEPPETWEELAEMAELLTQRGPDGGLIQLGFGFYPPSPMMPLAVWGGKFLDDEGRPVADHPANVKAFDAYRQILEVQGGGKLIDGYILGYGEYDSANNPFFMGKFAMWESGQWIPHLAEQYKPDLRFGITYFPHPAAHPEFARTLTIGGNFSLIPRDAKNPQGAWAFIEWTQTREAQTFFASRMRGLPNIKGLSHEPELVEGSYWNEKYGRYLELLENADRLVYMPPSPVAWQYSHELETATQYVGRGTKTPQQALRDVQDRLMRDLEPYLLTFNVPAGR